MYGTIHRGGWWRSVILTVTHRLLVNRKKNLKTWYERLEYEVDVTISSDLPFSEGLSHYYVDR